MEKLDGTNMRKSGYSSNSNLIKNEVLGWITKKQEVEAVQNGWIVKRDGIWKIAKGQVTCTNKDHSRSKGYNHNFGEYIDTASQTYQAHKEAEHKKDNIELVDEKNDNYEIETLAEIPNF